MDLAEVFKALADTNRLRILNLVSKQEICVCMIAEVLKTSLPNVSKHLNKLRFAGIIKCRKISQWSFYSMNESFKNSHKGLLDFVFYEMEYDRRFSKDLNMLENLLKTDTCCEQLLLANTTD